MGLGPMAAIMANRREGLKVPSKQPKKGQLWLNEGSCVRLRPERRDHVWSYDFVHCRTDDGIRHWSDDNGPAFIAQAVRDWMAAVGARTAFIEPGSPWENGYVESFKARFPDVLLNRKIFYSLSDTQIIIEGWRKHYNATRPHNALGYRPPAPKTICPTDQRPVMH